MLYAAIKGSPGQFLHEYLYRAPAPVRGFVEGVLQETLCEQSLQGWTGICQMKNMDQREIGRKWQGIPDAEEKGIHTVRQAQKYLLFK